MSQRAAFQEFDAACMADFADNGMADTGDYVSPDGDATEDITYFYDDTQFQDVGESGARMLVRERQIGLMLSEVTPVENGRVIGDDGRTWRLVAPTGEVDDSMSWWFVAPVRSDGA
jgi:hypothetical protein